MWCKQKVSELTNGTVYSSLNPRINTYAVSLPSNDITPSQRSQDSQNIERHDKQRCKTIHGQRIMSNKSHHMREIYLLV